MIKILKKKKLLHICLVVKERRYLSMRLIVLRILNINRTLFNLKMMTVMIKYIRKNQYMFQKKQVKRIRKVINK